MISAVLLITGGDMAYLGTSKKMMPPTITGVGFIVIAIAFLSLRGK